MQVEGEWTFCMVGFLTRLSFCFIWKVKYLWPYFKKLTLPFVKNQMSSLIILSFQSYILHKKVTKVTFCKVEIICGIFTRLIVLLFWRLITTYKSIILLIRMLLAKKKPFQMSRLKDCKNSRLTKKSVTLYF